MFESAFRLLEKHRLAVRVAAVAAILALSTLVVVTALPYLHVIDATL